MNESTEDNGDDWKVKSRSILKTSPNYIKRESQLEKKATFDEVNILQTYHPLDRDYGFIVITEPKTPYNFTSETEKIEHSTPLNTTLLLEKLGFAANARPRNYSIEEDSSDDMQSLETAPSPERSIDFDRRRKEHYKEYEVVKLAKELIKKDLEADDESEDVEMNGPSTSFACSPNQQIETNSNSTVSFNDTKSCEKETS